MFPQRMFPQTLFPERMFPKVGAIEAVVRTGGGWAQPVYVKKQAKEKRDPLIEELRRLASETEEKIPEKEVIKTVERIEARKAFIQSTPDYSAKIKALNALNLEIAQFRIELEKALKADDDEEEELILLLASL